MNHEELMISQAFRARAGRLRILIAAAAVLLVVGLVTPIITLEKFLVIENTFSVLSGVTELLLAGQWFLFVIIAGFSVVLPILKLVLLFRILGLDHLERDRLAHYLHWMHLYGKWSMLDVFVVAILVVAVKLGAIADVQMRFGLYAFAASVLLTMFVTARVVALTSDPEA